MTDLSDLQAAADAAIVARVVVLRNEEGYTWQQIGDALGCTRQAAHQRFAAPAAEAAAAQ